MSIHIPAATLWRAFRSDWWRLLKRTWSEAGEHNTSLLAAGSAFYAFSSIAPVLAATVLVYGIFADPQTVAASIRALFEALPREAAALIGGQLDKVVTDSESKQGLGLAIALAIALYGGSKATSSMMTALGVVFEVEDKRNFVMSTLVAIGIIVGAILLVLVGVATSTVTAFLSDLMPGAPTILLTLLGFGGYLALALAAVTGASLLYRFGPDLRGAAIRWGTPGAVLATVLWLLAITGFGIYVANFGDYGATYGSLSAIIVLLTWLWISGYAFLLGAELDHAIGAPIAKAAPAEPEPATATAPAATPARRGPVAAALLTAAGLVLLLIPHRHTQP